MQTSVLVRSKRLDAPFWAFVVIGLLTLGSGAIFGFVASQDTKSENVILETDHCPPPRDLL